MRDKEPFFVGRNVVYRGANTNTFKEHNESTSTWFGQTEQHNRGQVTPDKFPGLHIPPPQVPTQ